VFSAPLGRLGWKTCPRESMCQEVIRSLCATADFAGFLPWCTFEFLKVVHFSVPVDTHAWIA